MKQATNRLYYIDLLRFITVALLIPYHLALSYTGKGLTYVYSNSVIDYVLKVSEEPSVRYIALEVFNAFLDGFFMKLLFILAGISTVFSLKKRSFGQYLQERITKLFIPLLLGILFVVTILSYVTNVNLHGFEGTFFKFFPYFFNGIRGSTPEANFEWGHLWFLLYLFVVSLVLFPAAKLIQKHKDQLSIQSKAPMKYLFCILGVMLILELSLRPLWPGFQNLIDDWANLTNYSLLFLTGLVLGNFPQLREQLKKHNMSLVIIGLVTFAIIAIFFDNLLQWTWGKNITTLMFVLTTHIYSTALCLGFIGFGEKKLNHNYSMLKPLGEFSFPLYILHFIPITILPYWFFKTDVPDMIQFIFIVFISYPFTYILYKIIKLMPGLRMTIGLNFFPESYKKNK